RRPLLRRSESNLPDSASSKRASSRSVPIRIRRSGPVSSAAFAFPSDPVGQRHRLRARWLNGWFHGIRDKLRTTRDADLRLQERGPLMSAARSRRRLVLHEDDVGMCHGANTAFLELVKLGVCSSGAVMVPCPWFLELAEAAAADP